MNLAQFPRRHYIPAPTPVEFLPHLKDPQKAELRALAREGAETLNIRGDVPRETFTEFDDYVRPGYSLPTEAVKLFARLEGILLDPVYTGKTAAGPIDLVQRGHFKRGERLVFLHTGGAPALYAYQKMLGG